MIWGRGSVEWVGIGQEQLDTNLDAKSHPAAKAPCALRRVLGRIGAGRLQVLWRATSRHLRAVPCPYQPGCANSPYSHFCDMPKWPKNASRGFTTAEPSNESLNIAFWEYNSQASKCTLRSCLLSHSKRSGGDAPTAGYELMLPTEQPAHQNSRHVHAS